MIEHLHRKIIGANRVAPLPSAHGQGGHVAEECDVQILCHGPAFSYSMSLL